MSDLHLYLRDVIIRVFQIDLLDGYNLSSLFVHGAVHRPERASTELLQQLILFGEGSTAGSWLGRA